MTVDESLLNTMQDERAILRTLYTYAHAIDYGEESVEHYVSKHTGGDGFDIVYDTAGGATLDASFEAVSRFGQLRPGGIASRVPAT